MVADAGVVPDCETDVVPFLGTDPEAADTDAGVEPDGEAEIEVVLGATNDSVRAANGCAASDDDDGTADG